MIQTNNERLMEFIDSLGHPCGPFLLADMSPDSTGVDKLYSAPGPSAWIFLNLWCWYGWTVGTLRLSQKEEREFVELLLQDALPAEELASWWSLILKQGKLATFSESLAGQLYIARSNGPALTIGEHAQRPAFQRSVYWQSRCSMLWSQAYGDHDLDELVLHARADRASFLETYMHVMRAQTGGTR